MKETDVPVVGGIKCTGRISDIEALLLLNGEPRL